MVPASELLSISMLGYRCWSTHNPISIPSPVTERASNVQPAVLLQWAEHLPDVRTLQKECLECFLSCKFIAWDWMDSGSDFLVYTSCPLVTSPSKQVQISGFQIFFFFWWALVLGMADVPVCDNFNSKPDVQQSFFTLSPHPWDSKIKKCKTNWAVCEKWLWGRSSKKNHNKFTLISIFKMASPSTGKWTLNAGAAAENSHVPETFGTFSVKVVV